MKQPEKIPFEGEPVWIQAGKLYMKILPVLGTMKEPDAIKMAVQDDENTETKMVTFTFQKLTKEMFFNYAKMEFDCEHDFVAARWFEKPEGQEHFVVVEIPENDEKVKCCMFSTKDLPKTKLN